MTGNARAARDYRRRFADGRCVLSVEVNLREVIGLLVESGLLDGRDDCYSREEIAEAVSKFLSICRHA